MTFTKFDVEIRSYDENRNEHAEGKFAFLSKFRQRDESRGNFDLDDESKI